MLDRVVMSPSELVLPVVDCWSSRGFLLTAGDHTSSRYNTMTIGWGSLGVMWGMPIASIVVRPSRHTFGFVEKFDSFTLSLLPECLREALRVCGTISGRDRDKIEAAGLTPVPSTTVAAPGFAEAELIIECRKIYADGMELERLLDPEPMKHYPEGDVHVMLLGEIVAVLGTRTYATTEARRES